MKHSYSVHIGELCLCPMEEASIENMRLLRNRNRKWFVFSDEITPAGQKAWYQRYLMQDGDYMFSAFFRNVWVGAAALYNVMDGQAEFGRLMVDKEAAGRGGLGTEITSAVCRIGFQQLLLNTICLKVFIDNAPAQITYLKAGFRPMEIFCDQNGRRMLSMTIAREGEEKW